ncbi:hypothetical protein [Flavobacterium hungaricum]|uniref:Uncharacterized protein n=1 Tax=Flavobacterium hungaricum TaxID=2082725 RepID=A0ABR9TH93_9FLAO|nr:hypothetical protein [Flavobacterium hungaricum]MBE8724727.1 hypothetical protein [Flavobacterium hungaricum]
MHYLELLKAFNKDYRINFIQILKDKTLLNVSELSHAFDLLLDSKKVIITFKDYDFETLNGIVEELLKLEISFGECSFHEEFGIEHDVS